MSSEWFETIELNVLNLLKGVSRALLSPTRDYVGKTYNAEVLFAFKIPASAPNLPQITSAISSIPSLAANAAESPTTHRVACFARITDDSDMHVCIPDCRDPHVHQGMKELFVKFLTKHPIYIGNYHKDQEEPIKRGSIIEVRHADKYDNEYGIISKVLAQPETDTMYFPPGAQEAYNNGTVAPLGVGGVGVERIEESDLYDKLVAKGITPNLATAMVANAKAESALTIDAAGDPSSSPLALNGRCSHGLWQMNVCGNATVAQKKDQAPTGSPKYLGSHFLNHKRIPLMATAKIKLEAIRNEDDQIAFMTMKVKELIEADVWNASSKSTVEDWNEWFVRVIEQPANIESKITERAAMAEAPTEDSDTADV